MMVFHNVTLTCSLCIILIEPRVIGTMMGDGIASDVSVFVP